jgi:uncharacterized protein
MPLGQKRAISDICILVEDVERTVAFYTEKLGFKLRRRAEGFADFAGAGLTLAAWELDHIHAHTGVSNARSSRGAHKACIAVECAEPAEVDQFYEELSRQGVPFVGPPRNHVWNARCAYFTDPDGTVWELYAWLEGGPGDYHVTSES